MVFLFIFISIISIYYYDTWISFILQDWSNQLWKFEKNVTLKFISVFVTLLAWTAFLFSILHNIYKFNLLRIDNLGLESDICLKNKEIEAISSRELGLRALVDKYETLLCSIGEFTTPDDTIDKLIKASNINNSELIAEKLFNTMETLTTKER